MFRSGFFWKLYAILVVLILFLAGLVGVLVTSWIESDSLDEIQASLQARAVLLKEVAGSGLELEDPSSLQSHVESLGRELKTRITLIADDGHVAADSHEDPSGMDNHGNRPEVAAARSQGSGSSVRFSSTLSQEMMYFALPVVSGGKRVGFVRTALSLEEIESRLTGIRLLVLGIAGFAALIALVLGFFLARNLTRPLSEMTSVAGSIAAGDYSWRLGDPARKDEIGQLQLALQEMALSSKERIERIVSNRNELAAILGGMVEGVVAIDLEERVLHMNSIAGELLSAAPEGSLGRRIWEVTGVRDVGNILVDVLNQGTEIKRSLRIARRPRDEVIEMRSSPLLDGEGRISGAVVVLHNVTELQRLETVRQDFVANVSHELKTPIAAIRALVETLIDDSEMDPAVRERFLGKIRAQSFRLSSIVTDLLTLSRLESEGAAPRFIAVDLRKTVEACLKVFQPTGEEKGIQVESSLPDTPVWIQGDEEALGQMVNNLLDNALKYTGEGGEVSVRVNADDGWAFVEVRDTGIGIEPLELERIFERFYRVDKARSRELGGTGLGLSIVKHIVRTHKGEVQVESSPGKGSAFTIRLPLATIPVLQP